MTLPVVSAINFSVELIALDTVAQLSSCLVSFIKAKNVKYCMLIIAKKMKPMRCHVCKALIIIGTKSHFQVRGPPL